MERGPYILPLRVDDSKLDGLSPTIGYLDLRNPSIEEVCRLLSAKLGDPQRSDGDTKAQLTEAQLSTLRDVLSACYRRAVFTRYHGQRSPEAMFKSLSECRRALQTQNSQLHFWFFLIAYSSKLTAFAWLCHADL